MKDKGIDKLMSHALKHWLQNQLEKALRNASANWVQSISQKSENDLITEAELKRRLSLSSTTLWRYRKKGLPYKRIGKKIFYDFNNVVKYMGGQRYDR